LLTIIKVIFVKGQRKVYITILESLFTSCELELTYLDMAVNSKKSCCLRVGPRCDKHCKKYMYFEMVGEMRYHGLFIVQSRTFKCSLRGLITGSVHFIML